VPLMLSKIISRLGILQLLKWFKKLTAKVVNVLTSGLRINKKPMENSMG
jgi:hypothetical protein